MIRIVTDSSADLSLSVAAHHGIEVVPLTVRFGDTELVDRRDLTAEDFWQRLATTTTLPTTAAPSIGSFAAAYERLATGGATGIVAICISSELSGTYQAAIMAAADAPIPVQVVDSRSASISLGLVAIAAADAARLGADLEDVAGAVTRSPADLLATLDTLEFLQRGGRIGAAQAFFGGLLNVKPLITFTDGVVTAAGRVRTRRKALVALLDWVASQPTITRLGVVHGNAPDIEEFLEQLRLRLPEIDPLVTLAGPIIGTHAGPGVVGVAVTRT